MLDDQARSVLKRKTEAARARPEAAPPTPPRALGMALGKAGRQVLQLEVKVGDVTAELLSQVELLDLPEALSLFAVLEGPRDALGLMVISPSVMAGLIEWQTTGHITVSEPPARKPTRTDAAMTATFVDRVMQVFEHELTGTVDEVWGGAFRYASFLPDARPLNLILEDGGYRILRAEVKLAEGIRRGTILLALPAKGRGTIRKPPEDRPAPPVAPHHDSRSWAEALQESVMRVPTEVEAVLHRVTLPLSAVLGMEPGTIVPLPMAALENVVLQGRGGRPLAEGRLGMHRGHRAMRLNGSDGAAASRSVSLEDMSPYTPETKVYTPEPSFAATPAFDAQPAFDPQPAFDVEPAFDAQAAFDPEPAFDPELAFMAQPQAFKFDD